MGMRRAQEPYHIRAILLRVHVHTHKQPHFESSYYQTKILHLTQNNGHNGLFDQT